MVSKQIIIKETANHNKPMAKPCGSVLTMLRTPSERITAIPVMARIVFTNELIMHWDLSLKLIVIASFK